MMNEWCNVNTVAETVSWVFVHCLSNKAQTCDDMSYAHLHLQLIIIHIYILSIVSTGHHWPGGKLLITKLQN